MSRKNRATLAKRANLQKAYSVPPEKRRRTANGAVPSGKENRNVSNYF